MKFKASLLLILCAIALPRLVNAQTSKSSNCKVIGTPPICLFDTSYCPTTTEVACQTGDVSTLITYVNADKVTNGVVNQTSGNTTVTGQDGISVGVTNISEPNDDLFDGWFYPATFNVTSTGTYKLSGGTLTAGFETINGIMNQSGTTTNTAQSNPYGSAVYIHCMGVGSNNCKTVVVEQGTIGQLNVVGTAAHYNLESGTLNAPTLLLDSGGTFTQTGGIANVVEGQVEDQNLTTQPKSGLYVGYNGAGTYNLTGSPSVVLQVGGATTINGTAEQFPGYEYIGYNKGSTGTFNQSGGTNILGSTGGEPGDLYVGYSGAGNYNLSGGTLAPNYPSYEYIGYNPGSVGTFDQTAGQNGVIKSGNPSILTLYVGYTGTGKYTLGKTGGTTTSATLSAFDEYIGSQNYDFTTDAYVNGIGTFTQNAGTNQVEELYVGYQGGVGTTRIGTYNLVGGTVTSDTTGEGASEYIGFEGYGVFNQSGGTNNAEDLVLGDGNTTSPGLGIYNLSGTGALTVCCSNEVIGQGTDKANAFNQTGGTNTTLSIVVGNNGDGTYSLSKGTLKVGDLVLGEGSGSISAAFVQSGGTVDMIFTLDGFSETGTLTVAQTGKGSYALTAGTLNAGNEYVAEGMGTTGTFTQGAGSTNSMAANDSLYVGYGGKGTYTMNGGTLKASQEVVGGGNGINSGNGTFTEKGGTNAITASTSTNGNLEIGDVATGTYNLDGGALTAVSLAVNTTGSMVADKTGTAALTFKISGTTMNDGKMSFTDASASLGAFTNDGSLTLTATTTTAGKLTLGTYTQGSAGVLKISLDGKTAGTNYYALDVSGSATLGGTLDLTTGFTPVVGDVWDILNYTSEAGSFKTVNLPTAPTGDHYVFSCGAKDCSLTLDSGAAVRSGTQGAASGSPARGVSRRLIERASSAGPQQPVAILSRSTCFGTRLPGSPSCGTEAIARGASSGEMHASGSGSAGGEIHNNIMVATRSFSRDGGGTSREPSASAAEMARLYVCAYLPSSVAHTLGCN